MKRPGLKKASKRMSCSKKYRIEKNVRAHNRKLRRDAKKKAASGKVKQTRNDPGIPNSAPFKEELLRDAQLRKQRAEEERIRQKEARRAEVDKRRNLDTFQNDIIKRQKDFEKKTAIMQQISKNPNLNLLGSETSRKAYYKEFKKVIDNSDVVIEVLDARDPLGCRCLEVEKSILESGPNKKLILLLNKIDLVPKENVEAWLKYLRNEYPTVAFKASTQSQKENLIQCKVPLKQLNQLLLATTSQCVGATSLMKLLTNYCRHNDIETAITVGVVGFPNVGKSSVINSLKRAKACGVGATPGFTKTTQEVLINKKIKILDSPGIVMAKGNNNAAVILRNCVKVESIEDPITPVEAILSRCNKSQMMMRYNIADYADATEFLTLLARKHGKLGKGGKPRLNMAAKSILNDWNSGRIKYYTHPPLRNEPSNETHTSARIISGLDKEFDWASLEEDNLRSLEEVKGAPSQSGSVLYESSGAPSTMLDTENCQMENDQDMNQDCEDMDDDTNQDELGEIAVVVPPRPSATEEKVKSKVKTRSATKEEALANIVSEGSNIQANKQMKDLQKQNKKKRKRANKISDALGGTLASAMSLTSGDSEAMATEDSVKDAASFFV